MPESSGKLYLDLIARLQAAMLFISYVLIIALPIALAYAPDLMTTGVQAFLFDLSLFAAFLVLSVRPVADLFPGNPWLRPLVILRKGFGTFSAVIIVSFLFARVMADGFGYLGVHFLSGASWSFARYAFLAPLGDFAALVLLLTSNKFAKRILERNWKRVQKLAYVYFAAGALFEFLVVGNPVALAYLLIAAALGAAAFLAKRLRSAPALV